MYDMTTTRHKDELKEWRQIMYGKYLLSSM